MITYEPLKPEPIHVAAINGVANLDTKAIAAVEFSDFAPCTARSLGRAVMIHTGILASSEFVRQYPSSYLSYGFASRAEFENSFYYFPEHFSEALQVVGAFLTVAEKHDRSLIPYLSISNAANSCDHGQIAAPMTNLQLLDGILNGVKPQSINIGDYRFNDRYPRATLIQRRLRQLHNDNILELVTDPNEFYINNPTYCGQRIWKDLISETKAMYQTLTVAESISPGQPWTIDKLTDLAIKHFLVEEEQMPRFRRQLSYAASIKSTKYPGVIKKIDFKTPEYVIKREARAMAGELVLAAAQLSGGGDALKRSNIDAAHDLYNDPVTAARIFKRGMRHSKKTSRYLDLV